MHPASHKERPNNGNGTHEKHASQHLPTTHRSLGVPRQLLKVGVIFKVVVLRTFCCVAARIRGLLAVVVTGISVQHLDVNTDGS